MRDRFPKIRIYRRYRPKGGAERWEYQCSTTAFATLDEAVAGFFRAYIAHPTTRTIADFKAHFAETHGYYIED